MRSLIALSLMFVLSACGAPPRSDTASQDRPAPTATGSITVADAWAAPTPGGVDVSAGYLTLTNTSAAADRLVSASSPRATSVDLHEMSMDGGVMRMRALEGLEIAAGESVSLSPGANHLMFMGVTAPFAEGEEIPVQLHFEQAGAVDVMLPVRRGGAH